MSHGNRLNAADLRLLHEALAYARKRSFQQAETVRLQGLLDRVEELLIGSNPSKPSLRLSPPEQEVLAKEIPLYCEAMTQRGGSRAGSEEAARLREILEILAGRPRPWWRRFF